MSRLTHRNYEQQSVESDAFDISFCNLDNENHVIYRYTCAKRVTKISTQLAILLKLRLKLISFKLKLIFINI